MKAQIPIMRKRNTEEQAMESYRISEYRSTKNMPTTILGSTYMQEKKWGQAWPVWLWILVSFSSMASVTIIGSTCRNHVWVYELIKSVFFLLSFVDDIFFIYASIRIAQMLILSNLGLNWNYVAGEKVREKSTFINLGTPKHLGRLRTLFQNSQNHNEIM